MFSNPFSDEKTKKTEEVSKDICYYPYESLLSLLDPRGLRNSQLQSLANVAPYYLDKKPNTDDASKPESEQSSGSKTCSTCRWFVAIAPKLSGAAKMQYEAVYNEEVPQEKNACVKNAPVGAGFPNVLPNNFCGEWEAKCQS